MRKYKRYFIVFLTICFLCNSNYMSEAIFATDLEKTALEETHEEELNEDTSETDVNDTAETQEEPSSETDVNDLAETQEEQVSSMSDDTRAATTLPKSGFVFWNDDTKKALNPPAYSSNQAWVGSKLYWGVNGTTPMKWRILSTNETGFGQADGVLIMNDDSNQLSTSAVEFNPNGAGNTYMGSTLATFIDKQATTFLFEKEQNATLDSSKTEDTYLVPGNAAGGYKTSFSMKKWFAPTAKMMSTESYGFPNSADANLTRKVTYDYWFSSVYASDTNNAGTGSSGGKFHFFTVNTSARALSASQIDPNSILMVSNAVDGKKSGTEGQNALTAVPATASGEYKLTLKDSSQGIILISTHVDKSNLVTIKYSVNGVGDKLSAIITDKTGETIISYGRIATIASGSLSNQTATVQLPSDFFTKEYKLKVFTEIYNDNYKTDYASNIVDTDVREYHEQTYLKSGLVFWDDETKHALNPPTYSGDQAWVGSKLYWGYNTDTNTPIKWRILNTNETTFGQANGGVLIMGDSSDQLSTTYIKYTSSSGGNKYMVSELASFIDRKANAFLYTQELNATLKSEKTEEEFSYNSIVKDSFSDKIWFAPTRRMMLTESYGYSNTDKADKTRILNGDYFWLSLNPMRDIIFCNYVSDDGRIISNGPAGGSLPGVSASQIDPDSILMVSNAVDGKKSGTVGQNALTAVPATANGEYKLTLKDSSQTITVTSTFADKSNVATIKYNKTGAGTTLSAIITDKTGETIISYGRIATIASGSLSNQTATVQLPSDFFTKEYKLKVFTEIYNDNYKTDYASNIVDTDVREYHEQTYLKSGLVFWDDETKQALNPPAYSRNQAWVGSKLYWGVKDTMPMKWRILSTNETGFGQVGGILIMNDDTSQFENVLFHANSNIYTGSNLEKTIDGYYTSTLNTKEQAATLNSSNTDGSYTVGSVTYKDSFSSKKWFAPTAKMMATESYGYPNFTDANLARVLIGGASYWLASETQGEINANCMRGIGTFGTYNITSPSNRPVSSSQLDPDSILMVSNAVDGKKSGTVGKNALTAVPATASGEYKLTLKDPSQVLDVRSVRFSNETFNETNVAEIRYRCNGLGTTLSAIITDSDGKNIISYGQISNISHDYSSYDGIAYVTLPEDFFSKGYKLKLFTEIYNGDKKTDYASEIEDVDVRAPTTPTNLKRNLAFWNDETKKALNPATYSGDDTWKGCSLVWGGEEQPGGNGYAWNILNTNETEYGQPSGGVLIMSDFNSSYLSSNSVVFNPEGSGNAYMGSALAKFIDEKETTLLSEVEQNSTLYSSRTEDAYSVPGNASSYKDNFRDKKWFAPTVRIMTSDSYGFPNRVGHSWTRCYSMWTSSFGTDDNGDYVATFDWEGNLNNTYDYHIDASNKPYAVSQIDPNSILMVSNLYNGKSSSIGSNLSSVGTNNEYRSYKLTLKDPSQKLSIVRSIKKAFNDEVTIIYNKEGPGTSLSAIITDKDEENIISYGQIANVISGNWKYGVAKVKIPNEFFTKGYKLKVFTEVYDAYRTDYASEMIDVDVRDVEDQELADIRKGVLLWNDDIKEALNPSVYTGGNDWEGSKLYWGNNTDTSRPIKWRILNTNETEYGQPSGGVLIISDNSYDFNNNMVAFNPEGAGNAYMGSALAKFIDEKATTFLSEVEQNSTLNSSKNEGEYKIDDLSFKDSFSDKKWFAPTMRMMSTDSYGFINTARYNNIASLGGYTIWSSSASTFTSNFQGINGSGELKNDTVENKNLVASASQIDPDSILLVSHENAKFGYIASDFPSMMNWDSKEYKFTLKDPSQKLTVSAFTNASDDKVTITYNKEGPGTRLSAILTDKDEKNVISYAQIADLTSENSDYGKVKVTLPSEFFTEGYKLKVFSEVYNGDYQTDYASEMIEVTPTLAKHTVIFSGNGDSEIPNQIIDDGNKITKPTDPTRAGYVFAGWYIDESYKTPWNFENDIVSQDMTLYAKWNQIFHLTFDANTGLGKMDSINYMEGDSLTLPESTFTKVNYSFSGWNTKADGTGVTYKDKVTLSNMLASDMTLYAIWKTQTPVIYIDIPKGLSLLDDEIEKAAIKEETIKIVKKDEEAAFYPDNDISIRSDAGITLTNPDFSDTYQVDVYKADNTKYSDSKTPLALLNVKDESRQSSKFTLKTPKSYQKTKGTYTGVMNFVIEFLTTP